MNTASENIPSKDIPPVIAPDHQTEAGKAPAAEPTPRDVALHNIVVGALWCGGGIVVTATTYNAVKDTGGTYVIAWGAIIFGGIQFLKGLGQLAG